jgi:di/tricarboxylate transporter
MFSGMISLTLSSALWLTAMAGNPLGAEIARQWGLEISFGSWLVAASVPTLLCMILLPWVYYKIMRPEVTRCRTRQPRRSGRSRRWAGSRGSEDRRVDVRRDGGALGRRGR